MTTSQTTTERAQDAASTAADEGRHVAGVAKDEAADVASEAVHHARNLVGDAVHQISDQVGEQSRSQRDRLSGNLRSLGDDLEKMATDSGASGLAADLAREVADRAHAISSHLDGREPGELLDDVRSFARNRPGTFLLGALAAGIVAGRLARGAKDGAEAASAANATPTAPETPAAQGLTTNPPRPAASPGQPTIEPQTPSFADPAPTSSLDTEAPMGTPAAGYGERGTLGEDRP